jgi:putative ABC transport system substrate-binding protein
MLLGAAAAFPAAALAQRAAVPFIGFLNIGSPHERRHLIDAFRQGLKEAGFVDGKDVAIEYRWAEGHYERLPSLASELAQRQVAVLVTTGGPSVAAAAKAATSTIPIVFTGGGDPVALGLVASLSRPGGNITGVMNASNALEAKRLEVLLDLVPKAGTIAYLVNPDGLVANPTVKEMRTAAAAARKQLRVFEARSEKDFDATLKAVKQSGAKALVVGTDAIFTSRRDQLVALVARHTLPACYANRDFVAAGGLVSYGAHIPDVYRQAGIYAGRILKGAKPAELPVRQPEKFELVLNLKTAKKLGLTVSRDFLTRVDEVIQ